MNVILMNEIVKALADGNEDREREIWFEYRNMAGYHAHSMSGYQRQVMIDHAAYEIEMAAREIKLHEFGQPSYGRSEQFANEISYAVGRRNRPVGVEVTQDRPDIF